MAKRGFVPVGTAVITELTYAEICALETALQQDKELGHFVTGCLMKDAGYSDIHARVTELRVVHAACSWANYEKLRVAARYFMSGQRSAARETAKA
jgi:hypothetical protein